MSFWVQNDPKMTPLIQGKWDMLSKNSVLEPVFGPWFLEVPQGYLLSSLGRFDGEAQKGRFLTVFGGHPKNPF